MWRTEFFQNLKRKREVGYAYSDRRAAGGFVVSGRNGNIFSLVNDKKLDDEGSASMLKIIREQNLC